MPTKNTHSRIELEDLEGRAGVERSEPGGRAQLGAGDASCAGVPPLPGVPGGGPVERGELSDELIDELLGGAQTAEQIAGPDGLLGQLTRRLLERALQAELSDHLGYAPGQAPPGGAGNARNGQPAKTLITDQGPVRVRSPRDRKGIFDPKIVHKRQTRWVGFDDKVIALYARGLGARQRLRSIVAGASGHANPARRERPCRRSRHRSCAAESRGWPGSRRAVGDGGHDADRAAATSRASRPDGTTPVVGHEQTRLAAAPSHRGSRITGRGA